MYLPTTPLVILLALFIPAVLVQEQEECYRYCPEDVLASVFTHRLRDRVLFIQNSFTAALDGLELLQGKTGNITVPDAIKKKMGAKYQEAIEDDGEGVKRLRELLEDLIDHLLRADKRAWNRIIDTQKDIVDKSRSPKAPKDLPDLKFEIDNLDKVVRETEESFEPFLKELGGNLGKVMSSLLVVVESMLKAGGEDLVLEMMKEKVDSLMGRVLIKLVENKIKTIQTVQPRLLGDVAKLTEKLSYDFDSLGLKVRLSVFWKMELKTLEDYLTHNTVAGDDVEEDVTFIAAIIEKYRQ